jgi:hypothetical protein
MKKLNHFLLSAVAVIMFLGFSIGVVQAGPCELPDFASATFSNPTFIDNPYFTLIPGTIFRYEPVPNDDNVVNMVIVTNRTKKITVGSKKIRCLEVHDFETVDDVLSEDTLDWYAQDDVGNVWYCGEATEAYSYDADGNLIDTDTTGSWTAGEDVADLEVDALPGYVMLAEPAPGDCYQQEFYPDEAEDEANVRGRNATVTLENFEDPFPDCLETKEWSPLELGAIEQKIYAKNVVTYKDIEIGALVLNFEHMGKTVRNELISVTPPH